MHAAAVVWVLCGASRAIGVGLGLEMELAGVGNGVGDDSGFGRHVVGFYSEGRRGGTAEFHRGE